MKVAKQETQEAIARLREMIKPGDTVWTVLRDVSRSGMSRNIDCYLLRDGDRTWLSRLVARAIGFSFNEKRECLRVGGCGMDMGFHVVSTLSRVLYPGGFECIGKNCPSNDHSNGDRNHEPHHHAAGDYAVKQRWL